ncbi:Ankyrin repeat [Pseudoxanthomonas sp. CF125]|nr:Ankyrin repeat [Pseudoxanthomonas sp. CF125]
MSRNRYLSAFGNLTLALLLSVTLAACRAQPSPEAAVKRFPASNYFQGKALELAEAVDRNDAADVQRLIKQEGVNPDAIFDESAMPMVAWPVFNKNLPGLKLLLDNGADPNARRVDSQRTSGQQRNNALVFAAGDADSRYLAMLLDYGGDPNTRNSNGETLTHVAYLRDQWKNVQLLIEKGADINEGLYVPEDYDTVVSWYSGMGDFDKVYWLLQHGADPSRKMIAQARSANEGRMPILESIFWLPVKPQMIDWQRKCQRLLTERGIRRPPMPAYLKQKRQQLNLPSEEKDIPLL